MYFTGYPPGVVDGATRTGGGGKQFRWLCASVSFYNTYTCLFMHFAAIPKTLRLWLGGRTKQRIPLDEHLRRLLGKDLLEPCASVVRPILLGS